MALVTEQWSKSSFQRGKTASRSFVVTDCTDLAEACGMVPAQVDTTHPWDSRLIAEEPSGSHLGPKAWEVTVAYTIASEVGSNAQPEVGQPASWWWEKDVETEPAERSIDGYPLLMPSLEAITGLSQTYRFPVLVVERMEAGGARPSIVSAYDDTVNDDAITLFTGDRYSAGRILMEVVPTGKGIATNLTAPMAVQYRLKLSPYMSLEYWRVMAQIERARYAPDKFSPIYYPDDKKPDKEQISGPVLSDFLGKPIDGSLLVKNSEGKYVPPIAGPALEGVLQDTQQYATFLMYRRRRRANFSALGLFS